MATLHSMEA